MDPANPGVRWLAWANFRRKSLCNLRNCQDVKDVTCAVCNHVYRPRDIRMPESCPGCGTARKYQRNPCDGCKSVRIDKLFQSDAGLLLSRASELDFFLHAGVSITLREISMAEGEALRILHEERNKWQEEERKIAEDERRREHQQQQAQRQIGRR